ncbi:MAG: hypothetical protein DCC56_12030 [Anaerolineae bacterium]|nr:MAG: hypothetical protein DCC56_12030 [Anaerolineae bacterium]WKZ42321.1 MAG: DUF4870 domain-containing protein [Anaerolineales bacterium]
MNPKPAVEERVWSVLAHLFALAMGMGLILPVLGWAEQRRKSKYVAFQSLQALGYQTLGYTVWVIAGLLAAVVSIFFLLLNMDDALRSEAALTSWMIGHFSLTFALLGLYYILPVIAALACAFGKDFRYPFMGRRLAKYLDYDSEGGLNESHEDRWVAAAGHFSVIIAMWGLLVPAAAWILQGKRSAWLKFQSAQAIVLHVCALLLGFIALFLYMSGFVVFIALTGVGGTSISSGTGLIAVLLMFGLMLIALLILLFIPLFHIMGQWAGYRVLKGDDYRYPIIGKLIARWIPSGSHVQTT